ncbi:hypothetical protein KFL_005690040 [Klebsormidium nitens]|uniref:Uncharacterized protein n=1 Tax=Klebsormidium nitens TaxID=105231 RepID=A0A1Y1IK95_KLENI|nr:hypothetical protein KFL_005690040 [Klebsormidium nitens]|eukprot:GAQ89849.1 hypothetical protein KFL_005690040 [Klebsormidium nitens]
MTSLGVSYPSTTPKATMIVSMLREKGKATEFWDSADTIFTSVGKVEAGTEAAATVVGKALDTGTKAYHVLPHFFEVDLVTEFPPPLSGGGKHLKFYMFEIPQPASVKLNQLRPGDPLFHINPETDDLIGAWMMTAVGIPPNKDGSEVTEELLSVAPRAIRYHVMEHKPGAPGLGEGKYTMRELRAHVSPAAMFGTPALYPIKTRRGPLQISLYSKCFSMLAGRLFPDPSALIKDGKNIQPLRDFVHFNPDEPLPESPEQPGKSTRKEKREQTPGPTARGSAAVTAAAIVAAAGPTVTPASGKGRAEGPVKESGAKRVSDLIAAATSVSQDLALLFLCVQTELVQGAPIGASLAPFWNMMNLPEDEETESEDEEQQRSGGEPLHPGVSQHSTQEQGGGGGTRARGAGSGQRGGPKQAHAPLGGRQKELSLSPTCFPTTAPRRRDA